VHEPALAHLLGVGFVLLATLSQDFCQSNDLEEKRYHTDRASHDQERRCRSLPFIDQPPKTYVQRHRGCKLNAYSQVRSNVTQTMSPFVGLVSHP
jgi:hypothetical protein